MINPIICTDSFKNLRVPVDSKHFFHYNVNYICSQSLKMLGIAHTLTFYFSTIDSLLLSHFTLVRSKLEYGSPVWNNIKAIDANKLERVQQTFAALFHSLFPSHSLQLCSCSWASKISYFTSLKTSLWCSFFIHVFFQDPDFFLLWFIILFLEFLLVVLETSPSFLYYAIVALPPDVLLQIWYIVTQTYLEGQIDLWNRYYPSSMFHLCYALTVLTNSNFNFIGTDIFSNKITLC